MGSTGSALMSGGENWGEVFPEVANLARRESGGNFRSDDDLNSRDNGKPYVRFVERLLQQLHAVDHPLPGRVAPEHPHPVGVATIVSVPSATASRAISRAYSMFGGAVVDAGSIWLWISTNTSSHF